MRQKKEPKVTIIIPIYNAQETLHSCIMSVIQQTYQNLEIILINDGSTDQSFAICERFKQKDRRIILINQKNKGPSAARNRGILLASGMYIQFVDADDTLHEMMTEKLLQSMKKSDLTFSGYQIKRGKQIKKIEPPLIGTLPLQSFCHYLGLFYVKHLLPSPCNKLYRTKIIKKYHLLFPTSLKIGEDLYFNLNYLKFCSFITVHKDPFYIYHIYEHSLSNQAHENYIEIQFFLINQIKRFLINQEAYTEKNKRALQTITMQSIINSFSQLFQKYKNRHEIYQAIEQLLADDQIQTSLHTLKSNYQAITLKKLMAAKSIRGIYLFLKIKHYLKTNASTIYHLFKWANERGKN